MADELRLVELMDKGGCVGGAACEGCVGSSDATGAVGCEGHTEDGGETLLPRRKRT